MSTEDTTDTTAEQVVTKDPGEERIANIQAEVNRKIADVKQSNVELSQQLAAIMETLQARQSNGQSTVRQEKKLGELMYDNPEEFAATIAAQAVQQATAVSANQQAINMKAQQLEDEYPEFKDRTSEHYKRVEAHYKALSPTQRGTQEGLELAALKAAAEMGLQPKSKRKSTQNEDFSVSSGGTSAGGRSNRTAKAGDPTPTQQEFANLLVGEASKDPKFQAILKTANSRKVWNKYRAEGEE